MGGEFVNKDDISLFHRHRNPVPIWQTVVPVYRAVLVYPGHHPQAAILLCGIAQRDPDGQDKGCIRFLMEEYRILVPKDHI